MNFNLVGDFEQCVLERKEDVIVNDKMSGLIECTKNNSSGSDNNNHPYEIRYATLQ